MLLIKLIPFRYWSRLLGTELGDAPEQVRDCPDTAHEVGEAIRRTNRIFQGRLTCLMQAVAGKSMLNRRGIPNTLVLGVRTRRDAESELSLEAHAWLRCGSSILLGGETQDYFSVVARFRSPMTCSSKQARRNHTANDD